MSEMSASGEQLLSQSRIFGFGSDEVGNVSVGVFQRFLPAMQQATEKAS